jgi:N-acetylneuraminate synthase/N,N'-diacetyllegionaminate synthase
MSGADIAKFQFYDPDKIFGPNGSHPNEKSYQNALTVQFGYDDAVKLNGWCEEEGVEFMASTFDEERFEWVEALGVKRHKIASRSVEDTQLCNRILATGKETFISLGMWGDQRMPFEADNARYLYCVSKYPCEYSDIQLPISFDESNYHGFSDHTIGIEASLVAAGRGALSLEKHFTLNKGLPGPDHICSVTPSELAELCRLSRLMEKLN